MSRLFRLLVACALLGALVPALASASPVPVLDDGVIVVEGTGSGYVDFYLNEQTHPDPWTFEVDTTGNYAAYAITARTPAKKVKLWSAGLLVTRFKKLAGETFEPLPMVENDLPRGEYRMFLFSDGKTEIRIPTPGTPGKQALEIAKRVRAIKKFKEFENEPGGAVMDFAVERGKDSLTLMSMLSLVENHQGSAARQCLLTGEERECGVQDDRPSAAGTIATPGSTGEGWIYWSFPVFPGWPAPGTYVTHQRVVNGAPSARNIGFVLDVDLTAPPFRGKVVLSKPRTVSIPYQVAGVDGAPCGVFVGLNDSVGSCGFTQTGSTERFLTVKVNDAAGGPTAVKIVSGDKTMYVCGKTDKPLRIEPESYLYVQALANGVTGCETAHGTTGTVDLGLSSGRGA